jgi:hypothetical protein
MAEYSLIKLKKGIIKLTRKADVNLKIPGSEFIYAVSDTTRISNLFTLGISFKSYIYEWSFDTKTSNLKVFDTKKNTYTQDVILNNISELIDVLFEYSLKTKHRKTVVFNK